MPGVYRLKICPSCNKEHRKKGPYCSISCSNKARKHTEETKEKLKQTQIEHHKTPEGLAQAAGVSRLNKKKLEDRLKQERGEYVLQEDDWYVLPPDDDDGLVL